MIFLKNAALIFLGVSAGGIISAGIFSFLAIIGVFPRLMGSTRTAGKTSFYETFMILGGVWGNLADLCGVPAIFGGWLFLLIFGLSVGIFGGCLVMSLAETLKALPILNRRIRLSVGLQYVILAIAAGKVTGSFLYFLKNFGGA